MKHTTRSTRPLAALTCAMAWALLAACGGDPAPGANGAIPVGSVGEFTGFVASQSANDTSEPVDVESVLPPTSETAEPNDVT